MKPEIIDSDTNRSKRSTRAAYVALAGSIGALALLASLHVLSPEFDPSFRMVSEYAFGRYAWVLSMMFAVWAVSTWALAMAIWTETPTTLGKVGLWLLLVAGLGEALAAVFDVTHDLGHALGGLLGVGGLPVAGLLLSAALDHARSWRHTSSWVRHWCAHLTWIAVVLLVATMALMTVQFIQVNGGQLPQHAPKVLPPGVIGLDGWANRLIVLANCSWVIVVAWQAICVRRASSEGHTSATRDRWLPFERAILATSGVKHENA